MNAWHSRCAAGLCAVLTATVSVAQESGDPHADRPARTIADRCASMTAQPGFVDQYWDDDTGRLWWRLDDSTPEFLLQVSVASGLGSNPIGIDRGALGPRHVVRLRRIGKRLLLIADNLGYRASSEDELERRAVDESFADAVLHGFEIDQREGSSLLVDATDFVVRDWFGAGRRVGRQSSSRFSLDASRSTIEPRGCRSFPDNTECEALLTFASDSPSSEISSVSATGTAFTIRQRISLIRLPEPGYEPRSFDPRVGFFGTRYVDYAAPLGSDMQRHYIARHRLTKRDPSRAVDEVVEPIVYYLDPGVPEPVRSALKDGASWWADAFEAAGFRNAFRVEDLPPDADALDVRYNVIHWVHRSTRGWSYGTSVTDPRTGEILKGAVLLGSLRVRQDHMIFRGLGAPDDGCRAAAAPTAGHLLSADDPRRIELALARIRQLAAHEVGHTLGLSHNFAASGRDRSSVMDYPAPWVRAREGALDFSNAYAVGIGSYDSFAIRWGYGQPTPGESETDYLARVVREGLAQGHVYLTDQDARSISTMHPAASLWDNGADPVAELENAIEVRRLALASLRATQLANGTPRDRLEHALVPTLLHWRYQLDAAAKLLGGRDYRHALPGDGQPNPRVVSADRQQAALEAILRLLEPNELLLPAAFEHLVAAPGEPANAERLPRSAGASLDAHDAAQAQVAVILTALLDRSRLGRLAAQVDGLTVDSMLASLRRKVFDAGTPRDPRAALVQRATQVALVDAWIDLAADSSLRSGARSAIVAQLQTVHGAAVAKAIRPADHARVLQLRLEGFLEDGLGALRRGAPEPSAPPGSPIGAPPIGRAR